MIFLQETHSESEDVLVWGKHWKGKMYFSHGTRQSKGVAILTSYKSALELNNVDSDNEGRFICGEIQWDNSVLSVASVYAPNDVYSRVHFFDSLCDRINLDNHIIGGDFNCNIDSDVNDGSKIIFRNVLHEKDLVDAWRSIHPEEEGYTHFNKAVKKTSRID